MSTIGSRGSWGSEFKCEAPSIIDEVQYVMDNDQVENIRFRCTDPNSRKNKYLPEDGLKPENSTSKLFSLKCSVWGAEEVIGIHFVYEDPKGFTNIARQCRGTGNRTWATGTTTKGWARWGRDGLLCPGHSRIWNGRIKRGQSIGKESKKKITFISSSSTQ